MQLDIKHKKIILDVLKPILATHDVYVFGSRAKNTASKFSDLDLCIEGEKISFGKISNIKDQFSDSDLPYFVDLLQKSHINKKMFENIKSDFVRLE